MLVLINFNDVKVLSRLSMVYDYNHKRKFLSIFEKFEKNIFDLSEGII